MENSFKAIMGHIVNIKDIIQYLEISFHKHVEQHQW